MVKEMNEKDEAELSELVKFVVANHKGQYRKAKRNGKKIPFVSHPIGVSFLVINYFSTSEVKGNLSELVSVALAHDLLEDTKADIDELSSLLSDWAFEMVNVLTRPNTNRDLKLRNEEYVNGIKELGDEAIYVKICDSMHNLSNPEITPDKLVERTVNKARDYYLPLLENSGLSSEFEKSYIKAIVDAEKSIGIGPRK